MRTKSQEAGIFELLEHLGCRYIESRSDNSQFGDKLVSTCPMHEDASPSFMIRTEEPWFWNCFVDGKGMGLISLVQKSMMYKGCSRSKAAKIVAQFVDINTKNVKVRRDELPPLPPIPETHLAAYSGEVEKAYRYMKQRGFTEDFCKEMEIGYDKIRSRVVIPIRDADGYLVAFQGRTTFSKKKLQQYRERKGRPLARYLVYNEVNRERLLLGSHDLEEGAPLTIVEGPMDYLRLKAFGVPNVIALLGSKPTFYQIKFIKSTGLDIDCWLDNDDAGGEGTWVMMDEFSATRTVRAPLYDDSDSDPGGLSRSRFKALQATLRSSGSVRRLELYS